MKAIASKKVLHDYYDAGYYTLRWNLSPFRKKPGRERELFQSGDKDGKAEVVHWRMADGNEWLVIADGQTGKIKNQTAWPTKPLPHVYNNFRLAIAKLTPGDPNEIAVFTDMGGTMNVCAYDANLKQLWRHTENRKKDNLGHYIYPVDLDKDGIDEVLVGSLLLNSKRKKFGIASTCCPIIMTMQIVISLVMLIMMAILTS